MQWTLTDNILLMQYAWQQLAMQLELWAIDSCQGWCVLERSLSVAGVEMRRIVSVSNAAAVTARVPPAALLDAASRWRTNYALHFWDSWNPASSRREMGKWLKENPNWSKLSVDLNVLLAHGSKVPLLIADCIMGGPPVSRVYCDHGDDSPCRQKCPRTPHSTMGGTQLLCRAS